VTSDGYAFYLTDGVSGDQIKLDYELYSSGYGVQDVDFADGTVWSRADLIAAEETGTTGADTIYGTSGADTIDGKGGNDVVNGEGGADTFIYNSGYGHLEISDGGSSGSVLQLGTGIDPSDVGITSDGYHIYLTDGVSGDQVKLDYEAYGSSYGVQDIDFADGAVWTRQDLIGAELTGTSGNDSLYGTSGNNTFDGDGGTDYENGEGGDDTYKFNSGYGTLTINNADSSAAGAHGELDFGTGVSDEDLWFTQSGNDLVINRIDSTDKVTVSNWFSSNTNQLSEIKSGGLEIDSEVASLISAMATYSADNPGFDPSTTAAMPTDTTLQSAISAAWHS
jgi:Ca2+-binding RTX toxin-like protein